MSSQVLLNVDLCYISQAFSCCAQLVNTNISLNLPFFHSVVPEKWSAEYQADTSVMANTSDVCPELCVLEPGTVLLV